MKNINIFRMMAKSMMFILFLFISSIIYPDDIKSNLRPKYGQLSEDEILKEIDRYNVELTRSDISIDEGSKIVIKINSLYNSIGRHDKSVQILGKFINSHKGSKEEPHLLLVLGMEYVMLGEIEKASNSFTEIIKKYPDDKMVKYAKKELELLKNRNFVNLMEEGREELFYVKNLSPVMGWVYVMKVAFKRSTEQFLIILFLIIIGNYLPLFKLRNKSNISTEWNLVGITLATGVVLFIRPIFRFVYLLFKYGANGHFLAHDSAIKHSLNGNMIYFTIDILASIAILLFIFIFFKNKVKFGKILFFKDIYYFKNIILSMLFACIAFVFLKCTAIILLKNFTYKGTIQEVIWGFSIEQTPLIGLFYILVIVPFVEELFFRGIIFNNLSKKLNIFSAMVLSSLSYTLYYLNFQLVPLIFLFLCGLMFSYLYRKLGLLSSFLAHSFYIIANYFII